MSRLSANFLMLLAGLFWGLGFVAQASAMDHIGPFQFVFTRFLLATIIVSPFVYLERRKLITNRQWIALSRKQWLLGLLVGSIFAAAMISQQIGILGTSVTNAGMLTGLYVILVPIILSVCFGEQQPRLIWGAAFVALSGIWLLGGGGLDRFTWGDAVIIGSAFLAAGQVIAVGKAVSALGRPVAIAASQFAVTACLGLLGYIFTRLFEWQYEPKFEWDKLLASAPEVIYAAVFAGVVAFTLQAIAQRHTTSSDAAILLSSEALFAALGGALILGERLDWLGYLGCSLLFAAIVAVSTVSARMEEANAA